MSKATKETVELLSQYVPAEARLKIEQAVEAMAEEIRSEAINESVSGSDPVTAGQVKNLTEQRDEATERARMAEQELAEARGDIETIVEKAKKAVEDEMKDEVDKAAEIIANSENEKDELAEALRDEYEKKLKEFKEEFITKTSKFIDGRLHAEFQKLGESVSNDPTKVSESDAFKRIAEIVENFSTSITGGITENEAKDIREEVVGLRAQVRQIEASNARLRTENRLIREKNGVDGELVEGQATSGKSDLNPKERLADKEGNKTQDDDAYEPSGNIKRDKSRPGLASSSGKGVTESASSAAQRASVLLKEALSDTPQGSDEDGWASTIGESRANRQARASEVEGSGITIQESDIVKETTDNSESRPSRLDESIIPGTGTNLGDFKRMAGVPAGR